MSNSRHRGSSRRQIEAEIKRIKQKIRAAEYRQRTEKTHRTVAGTIFQQHFYSTPEARARTVKQRSRGVITA